MSIKWRVLLLIFGVAILVILAFAKMLYFTPSALEFSQERTLQKNDILAMASEIARENNINEELFIKVMLRESNASSTIKGDYNLPKKGCVSYGLWQFNICPKRENLTTKECALNAQCSTNRAAELFKQGRVELWTSWNIK